MSFGLTDASFQRIINVLMGLTRLKFLDYLDDIVVYGYDPQ